MYKKTFTLYWLNGDKEIIKGKDVIDALVKAGHENVNKLDFFIKGVSDKYVWSQNKWTIKI